MLRRRRKREKKLQRKDRRIKNKIRLRTIILLIITLMTNTYAWFLYATTVSVNLTAHVDAWHIQFEVNNTAIQQEVNFEIQNAYPGMANTTKIIDVRNIGEKKADLTYKIKSIRIFNTLYVSSDSMANGQQAPQGATVLTEQQLRNKLLNDYPFTFTTQISQNTINVGSTGRVTLTFHWDYEEQIQDQNNINNTYVNTVRDVLDTTYGLQASQFYSNNPNTPAIQIVVAICATQHID